MAFPSKPRLVVSARNNPVVAPCTSDLPRRPSLQPPPMSTAVPESATEPCDSASTQRISSGLSRPEPIRLSCFSFVTRATPFLWVAKDTNRRRRKSVRLAERTRFDEIHWREQRIVLVQSKSQRRLELPLLAEVDEALVSYIRDGRPSCPVPEIFVRHVAPIGPLSRRNNLWPVMSRALVAAGIEIPTGERGFRLLRHCAATRLLRRGVAFETISDILGHASVDTTRRYAQVDLASLRSVALSDAEVYP